MPTDEPWSFPAWIPPLLYAIAVAVSAGLLSFLCLLLVVQFTADGEQAMWYGVTWVFLLPWILMVGFAGRITFQWYRQQPHWTGATAVCRRRDPDRRRRAGAIGAPDRR